MKGISQHVVCTPRVNVLFVDIVSTLPQSKGILMIGYIQTYYDFII